MPANLYIWFKPSTTRKYVIIWKKATDATFPINNYQNVTVATPPGDWFQVIIPIDTDLVDWVYSVIPVCNDKRSNGLTGVVHAVCNKVTFEGTYINCPCPQITALNIQFS